MNLRLVYLDLLGYTNFKTRFGEGFVKKYEFFADKFLNDKVSHSIFNCHSIYRNHNNCDCFYIASEQEDEEQYETFSRYCAMLSYRYVFALINYDFLFRGYLTHHDSPNNYACFSEKEISDLVEEHFDFMQKTEEYPRIRINNLVVPKSFRRRCLCQNIIYRRKNSNNSMYFLNPFYILHDKSHIKLFDELNSEIPLDDYAISFYKRLKEKVQLLLSQSRKMSETNPYKKYIWLASQFDKYVRENDLPYESILGTDELKYVAFSGYIELKSLEVFLSFKDRILNLYIEKTGSTINELFDSIKKASRKRYSYNSLKCLFLNKKCSKLPKNTYAVLSYVLFECHNNNCFENEKEYKDYISMLDSLYLGVLNEIHANRENSFVGYILENERIKYLKIDDNKRIFNYKKL